MENKKGISTKVWIMIICIILIVFTFIGIAAYIHYNRPVDVNYEEDTKIAILMKGNYITNTWAGNSNVDFSLVKGIVEILLDYLGLRNRYGFEIGTCSDLHPGMSANILLDRESGDFVSNTLFFTTISLVSVTILIMFFKCSPVNLFTFFANSFFSWYDIILSAFAIYPRPTTLLLLW